MTFTNNLATAIGKVRLEIGDDVENSGVRPDGTNLSDEAIQVLLDREEDDEMRAAAAACELLARHWARFADITLGPRRESLSQVAAQYRAQAAELRDQHGYGEGGMFSVGTMRGDGYSSDIASDDLGEDGW